MMPQLQKDLAEQQQKKTHQIVEIHVVFSLSNLIGSQMTSNVALLV